MRNRLWEMGYAVDTLETATDWAKVPKMIKAIESALRTGLADIGERIHALLTFLISIPMAPAFTRPIFFESRRIPKKHCGGGITGAGILREGTRPGLKTMLPEQRWMGSEDHFKVNP